MGTSVCLHWTTPWSALLLVHSYVPFWLAWFLGKWVTKFSMVNWVGHVEMDMATTWRIVGNLPNQAMVHCPGFTMCSRFESLRGRVDYLFVFSCQIGVASSHPQTSPYCCGENVLPLRLIQPASQISSSCISWMIEGRCNTLGGQHNLYYSTMHTHTITLNAV